MVSRYTYTYFQVLWRNSITTFVFYSGKIRSFTEFSPAIETFKIMSKTNFLLC